MYRLRPKRRLDNRTQPIPIERMGDMDSRRSPYHYHNWWTDNESTGKATVKIKNIRIQDNEDYDEYILVEDCV